MFHLDTDLCYSAASVLYGTPDYKDVNVCTLGEVVSLMNKLQHDRVYKNFYKLAVVLLTVPVMSASCKRCHSKVAFVNLAVRTSVTSHCLRRPWSRSLLNNQSLTAWIYRMSFIAFAPAPRGLPL